jgi:DNA-binding NtrC family response regulator
MAGPTILIVDDEKNILSTLSRALRVEDYKVDVAGNAEIAWEKISSQSFDCLLLDVNLPGMNGLDLLDKVRASGNAVPVIMMSGHGSIETAVQATQRGALDFIEKPVGTERLLLSIRNCLDHDKLRRDNEELKKATGELDRLLGQSSAMSVLRERVSRAADAAAPVLVVGERGTGKELVARALHRLSPRADGPLEKLNCAAVPRELIESELFGHEAGAFTGATKQRRGKFERAHGGTLFLDEVGDMPASMQAKLLRVLQEGELERVGGNALIAVDTRVVAATNKSLTTEIEEGRFRADLYDRLNVLPIVVPPLRDRGEDTIELAEHFLTLACQQNGRARKTLTDAAGRALVAYGYPGNVRELRNIIERLVILTHAEAETLTEADIRGAVPLSAASGGGSFYQPGKPLRGMLQDAERDFILRALDHNRGHITNTAADLGLERSHLYKKMKALGIRRGSSGEIEA